MGVDNQVMYCMGCHVPMHTMDNYCSMCGKPTYKNKLTGAEVDALGKECYQCDTAEKWIHKMNWSLTMAKPNLDHLLMTIHFIEGIEEQEYAALRKRIHHALYYHNKGWVVLKDEHFDVLIYGMQYMYAVEATDYIDMVEDYRQARSKYA